MRRNATPRRKTILRIFLIALTAVVLLSVVIVGMCLFIKRPAVQTLADYQSAFGGTTIDVSDDGGVTILPLNGAEKHTGVIFYVGAQIEPSAYIPMLARVSEAGYPCFIPKLTYNMAPLEFQAAAQIMQEHSEISSWVLAGHSMGGLTASGFADDHRDSVDGLILVAAYTNRNLSDADIPVLAIFGNADGAMNGALYEKRKSWNPADFEEYIIAGANHAQYGDYGAQPRDQAASISAEEQQSRTAEIILDWLDRHSA